MRSPRTRRLPHPPTHALVLALAGLLGVTVALLFAGGGIALVAVLVAGIAVVPVTFALYLRLLVSACGPDGPGGSGPDDLPPDAPGPGGAWVRFERDFWAYVERQRLPVA